MTPDTLIIDRTFRGLGRLKKATGTTNPAMRRKLNRMLTALADGGRLDILRAIRDGKLTLAQVYDAFIRRDLDALPTADTIQPLVRAMRSWIDALESSGDCSHHHAVSLKQSVRYIEKAAPKAALHELDAIIESLRTTLGRAHPRSFNLARAAALAFVRDTLKRSHPLWNHIAAVRTRPIREQPPRPILTPARMRSLFPNPGSDRVDAIAWAMVTTGMHAKEYWGQWETQLDRVRIYGTKRKGRRRDVPLVMQPAVPRLSRSHWQLTLRRRETGVQPYDFRRAYAQWMEEAHISRARRKAYLGHGKSDVTDVYERHEVTAFLVADAEKLRAFLDLPPTIAHTVPKLEIA